MLPELPIERILAAEPSDRILRKPAKLRMLPTLSALR